MHQFITPKTLEINGRPAPCECRDRVVCVYCFQANLILWERKEHPEENVKNRGLKVIKKIGPRKTGRLLMVEHSTVSRWIKKKSIPSKYIEKAQGILEVAI